MANITDTLSLDRAETMSGFSGGQTILNRYRLGRILGQGGMGVVWLARDEKLDRDVALKFLPDIVVNDRASLNDLIRETRRSLELTHPNIVRTYDFVQDSNIAGISMEYVDSDTLRNLRIDQPNGVYEPGQVGEWIGQLCGALQYAHSQASIVHRDLKPANLMINGRGQLKVADFGISRSLVESVSQMTVKGGASGTLVYMSPQQLSGDSASGLDDIYSLGATLYELFTTRPPFYSGDIAGQVHNKVAPSVAQRRASLSIPVADFPSHWEETIAACLAKNPEQRPQSATEVAVRLGLVSAATLPATAMAPVAAKAGAMAPPPIAPPAYGTATAPLPSAPPPAGANRRTALIAGAAVAMAAVILTTVGLLWHSANKQEAAKQEAARQEQVKQEQARQEQDRKEQARQEQVRQEQARQEQVRLAAERLANARGSLFVRTEPAGASVKIGDHPPVKSPAPIKDLKLGKQEYQIELDGYDPVIASVEIEENKMADPPVVTLVPSKGALVIQSDPSGLAFELKSKANPLSVVRDHTPFTASSLPVGDYEVVMVREGWPVDRKPVTIRRGQEENKIFTFPGGSVTINSDTPGATVQYNGKDMGPVPYKQGDLPPGPAKFTVVAEGYDKMEIPCTIKPGEDVPLQATLKKTAAHTATHRTNSSGKRSSGNNEGGGFDIRRYVPSGMGGGPSFGPRF